MLWLHYKVKALRCGSTKKPLFTCPLRSKYCFGMVAFMRFPTPPDNRTTETLPGFAAASAITFLVAAMHPAFPRCVLTKTEGDTC